MGKTFAHLLLAADCWMQLYLTAAQCVAKGVLGQAAWLQTPSLCLAQLALWNSLPGEPPEVGCWSVHSVLLKMMGLHKNLTAFDRRRCRVLACKAATLARTETGARCST